MRLSDYRPCLHYQGFNNKLINEIGSMYEVLATLLGAVDHYLV